jgi:hypothetical protein
MGIDDYVDIDRAAITQKAEELTEIFNAIIQATNNNPIIIRHSNKGVRCVKGLDNYTKLKVPRFDSVFGNFQWNILYETGDSKSSNMWSINYYPYPEATLKIQGEKLLDEWKRFNKRIDIKKEVFSMAFTVSNKQADVVNQLQKFMDDLIESCK